MPRFGSGRRPRDRSRTVIPQLFDPAPEDGAGRAGPPPATRDPEFASGLSNAVEAGRGELIDPCDYLRLVANPFLGLLGLAVWFSSLRWVIGVLRKSPELIGPLTPILAALFLASLALVGGLFQYHCLDCGGTGRLGRWPEHRCPISSQRRREGRSRWLRGPTPPVQVLLWLIALAVAVWVADGLGLGWWNQDRGQAPQGARRAVAGPIAMTSRWVVSSPEIGTPVR
jgi:hypothetical protein